MVVKKGKRGAMHPFVFFLQQWLQREGRIMPTLMFFFIAFTIVGVKREL
jgi:hypothetical protein